MKKVVRFFKCAMQLIKKKFFKEAKADIYQDCKEVLNFDETNSSQDELNSFNEYLENYKVTTRWQTL
ncbi:MAG: hypothetical protein JXR61_10245 [Prolixibacteraceae bacterium]|nr:hypothetical protein [Prolixibacteraceae bacterium]